MLHSTEEDEERAKFTSKEVNLNDASWRDAWRREFEKRGWTPPKWCVRPFDKESKDGQ